MVLPLIWAAFETAIIASDAVALAGLEAAAAAAVRGALVRYAPGVAAKIAGDALVLSGATATTVAAGTAIAGRVLLREGKLTAEGVAHVATRVETFIRHAPELEQSVVRIQQMGAKFYPVSDDGICFA